MAFSLVMLNVQVDAAEEQGKAVILINPKLVDIPSSGGVMGVRCSLRGHVRPSDAKQLLQTSVH